LESGITSMSEGQQAGWSRRQSNPNTHAALWAGTAASWRDINPPSAGLSILFATCGIAQAGYANIGGVITAGVWFGTAESFVRLDTYLPQGVYYESVATSVSVADGMLYVGGYAANAGNSYREAYVWVAPVPGPPGIHLLVAAGALAVRWRRPHGRRGSQAPKCDP
jgi:hypothetical protein